MQVNVEQNNSLVEDRKEVNCSSVGKSASVTESEKDTVGDKDRHASVPESALLISEKCRLLKRKHYSEEPPDANVPSKIAKRGKIFNYFLGMSGSFP